MSYQGNNRDTSLAAWVAEKTGAQPGQAQLEKMASSLLQNAGSTKMKSLTDKEIFEIRDAIGPRDGWDGDAWDLALGNAIQDAMLLGWSGAAPSQT